MKNIKSRKAKGKTRCGTADDDVLAVKGRKSSELLRSNVTTKWVCKKAQRKTDMEPYAHKGVRSLGTASSTGGDAHS